MGSRSFHIVIILFWMASMTWLITAKVLPPLLVGDPPNYRSTLPTPREVICWKILWNNEPLGWAATRVDAVDGGVHEVHNRVVLEDLPLSELLPPWLTMLVRNRIGHLDLDARTRTDIDPFGQLASFVSTVRVSGIPNAVRMNGRVTDGYLDTVVQVGELQISKEVRLEKGALVNGEFSPLAVMPGLQIGQTWTFWSFSPLRPPEKPMEPLQAVVTGEDWIDWNGRGIRTLVVEYRSDSGTGFTAASPPRGKMWVHADGRIVQQEVSIMNSQMRFVRMSDSEAEAYRKQVDEDWFISLEYAVDQAAEPAQSK